MRGGTDSYPRPEQRLYPTDESDVAVALVRTAFIIAFALTPYIRAVGPVPSSLVTIMLPVGATFTIFVFSSYLWEFPLPLQRPLALIIDLLLVTGAVLTFDEGAPQRQWLAAMYYLVIMVAAIWYRRTGAVLAALLASALDAISHSGVAGLWLAMIQGQSVPMLMIAVAASYIVIARDREREHANRLENDMRLAKGLQDRMFPTQLPEMPGVDLGLQFKPARQVGGDLYDAVQLTDKHLLICVGDMPGKSVYGVMHLSLVHSHMRAALREGMTPAEMAEFTNRNVYEALQPDSYATLFIGCLDTSTGTLTFVNCGHLPPILVRASNEHEPVELSSGGIVIGGKLQPAYRQETAHLDPGDVVVCYTDGITEARGRRRREFGAERLVQVIRDNPDANADKLAHLIIAATDQFSYDALMDDRTVLVLKAGNREPQTPDEGETARQDE